MSQVDASSAVLHQDGHTRCFELVQWLAAQGQLGGPDEVGEYAQILELHGHQATFLEVDATSDGRKQATPHASA